jgi:catalase
MFMWAMSDRGIPRSFRMMQGFGVNTFRLVNKDGVSHFVKFHFRPTLGVHSLVWDEALKIGGQDPDFHRKDLYEAIDMGVYPKWKFGLQILSEDRQVRIARSYLLTVWLISLIRMTLILTFLMRPSSGRKN